MSTPAVLGALSAAQLARLAATAEARRFAVGEVLVRAGEPGDALYVVLDGAVRVRAEGPNGPVALAELGPGAFFGEIALLCADGRRTATVEAVTPGELLRVPATDFTRLRIEDPALGAHLERLAATRQVHTFLRAESLFSEVPDARLLPLLSRLETQEVPAGAVIMREGEPGDAAWLLLDGAVKVVAGEPPRVLAASLERGALIGELALLSQAPRNATVVALMPCRLLRLPRDAFEALLAPAGGRAAVQDVARLRGAPRRAAGASLHRLEGGVGCAWLLERADGVTLRLSERGAFLWERVDGETPVATLGAALHEHFGAGDAGVVLRWADRLEAEGFLVAPPRVHRPPGLWRRAARWFSRAFTGGDQPETRV